MLVYASLLSLDITQWYGQIWYSLHSLSRTENWGSTNHSINGDKKKGTKGVIYSDKPEPHTTSYNDMLNWSMKHPTIWNWATNKCISGALIIYFYKSRKWIQMRETCGSLSFMKSSTKGRNKAKRKQQVVNHLLNRKEGNM